MIYNNFDQLKQALNKEGRLLGLDVGTKNIGVAISDLSRLIANPKLTLNRQSNQKDFLRLREIITENKIAGVVMGLPLNMDGSESEMSQFVRRFADNFAAFFPDLPVVFFDERLSSFMAEDMLREEIGSRRNKKNHIDQIAASLILQGALEELS